MLVPSLVKSKPHFTKIKLVFIGMLFFSICTAIAAASSQGELVVKDYGTHGQLFNIKEVSLLEEIAQKLAEAKASGKLDGLQEEFKRKVKEKVLRPVAVAHIKKARKNRSWTYSPIYRQETDIKNAKGRVIVPAGTVVNGLDKLSWGEPLIFIDGDDKEQVNWAKARKGKIVLTNGAPLDLQKTLNRRVYFDQGGIYCHRFKIEAVPAIVEQDGTLLKISEVAL